MDPFSITPPTPMTITLSAVFLAAALLADLLSPNDRAADRHFVLVTGLLASVACLLIHPLASGLAFAEPLLGARAWGAVLVAGAVTVIVVQSVGAVIISGRIMRGRDPSPRLGAIIAQCAGDMGLAAVPSVVICDRCRSPFVSLYGGYTIVLPPDFEELGFSAQRGVLMHEMAHLRRGDCSIQLLCQLAGAALWWNPLYWIAMRRIALQREIACDAAVLVGHHDPAWYADLLVRLAHAGRTAASLAFATTPMAQASTLTLRLRALRSLTGRFNSLDAVVSPIGRTEMLCWVAGLFTLMTIAEGAIRYLLTQIETPEDLEYFIGAASSLFA